VSHHSPHKEIYGIPEDLPTLHSKFHLICLVALKSKRHHLPAVDDNDYVVPAARTIELQKMCKKSVLNRHNEGMFFFGISFLPQQNELGFCRTFRAGRWNLAESLQRIHFGCR